MYTNLWLAITLVLTVLSAAPVEAGKTSIATGAECVDIITDVNGNATRVTDLKLLIQGRRNRYAKNLVLQTGDAQLTLEFASVASVERTGREDEWKITLMNGNTVTGRLLARGDNEFFVGKALIGNLPVDYKISIDKTRSVITAPNAGVTPSTPPQSGAYVSIVTDSKGNQTTVTDLNVFIRGRRNRRVKGLVVRKSEAELTIDFAVITTVENIPDTDKWNIVLVNDHVIESSLHNLDNSDLLVAKALVGDMKVDYEIQFQDIKSVVRNAVTSPTEERKP